MPRRRRPATVALTALAAALTCTCVLVGPAGAAATGEPTPADPGGITAPHSPGGVPSGPVGPAYLLWTSASLYSGIHPGAQPQGVNDFSCRPAPGDAPVVLLPGTYADAFSVWSSLAPKLKAAGLCVFTLNYNPATSPLQESRSFSGDIRQSAAFLAGFVDRVRAATGADKVDLVGHSQGGGPLPRSFIKWYGGDTKVRRLVGLGPSNLGSTFGGLDRMVQEQNSVLGALIDDMADNHNMVALKQQIVGSDFLAALNSGPLTAPGIQYTFISSKNDVSILPYTNAFVAEPGVANITLQDVCPWKLDGHPELPFDPAVQTLTLNALRPAQNQPVNCW